MKTAAPPSKAPKPQKLGYMEERELRALPRKIEELESRQGELFAAVADPDFYKSPKEEIARVKLELETVAGEIETAYRRWETLEEKKGGAS